VEKLDADLRDAIKRADTRFAERLIGAGADVHYGKFPTPLRSSWISNHSTGEKQTVTLNYRVESNPFDSIRTHTNSMWHASTKGDLTVFVRHSLEAFRRCDEPRRIRRVVRDDTGGALDRSSAKKLSASGFEFDDLIVETHGDPVASSRES
jgi:hypothetical protein